MREDKNLFYIITLFYLYISMFKKRNYENKFQKKIYSFEANYSYIKNVYIEINHFLFANLEWFSFSLKRLLKSPRFVWVFSQKQWSRRDEFFS